MLLTFLVLDPDLCDTFLEKIHKLVEARRHVGLHNIVILLKSRTTAALCLTLPGLNWTLQVAIDKMIGYRNWDVNDRVHQTALGRFMKRMHRRLWIG